MKFKQALVMKVCVCVCVISLSVQALIDCRQELFAGLAKIVLNECQQALTEFSIEKLLPFI